MLSDYPAKQNSISREFRCVLVDDWLKHSQDFEVVPRGDKEELRHAIRVEPCGTPRHILLYSDR